MSDFDIKLLGDDEILAAFHDLDRQTQHRRLKQVLNKVGDIPKRALRSEIPVRRTKLRPAGKKWHPPGTGKKSVYKKMGRSKKNATVFVGPRTRTGTYQTDAFYLKFYDLFRPGRGRISRALERSLPEASKDFITSMRTIIYRAWKKTRR